MAATATVTTATANADANERIADGAMLALVPATLITVDGYRWNQEQLRRGFVFSLESEESQRQHHAIGDLRELVYSIAWNA